MRIDETITISHPADQVFLTLRDHSDKLASLLPNCDGMQELSRSETPPVTKIHNRWQGGLKDVPAVIRPFISAELVAWLDYAEWNTETRVCQWRIEPIKAKEVFDCRGSTTITPIDDQTSRFDLQANLTISPDKVPGVPKFLASKFRDPLEKFIGNALRPNFTSIAQAVQKYLDENRK